MRDSRPRLEDDASDAALLAAAAAGAEAAFVALYRRRRDDVYRFAYAATRSRSFAQAVVPGAAAIEADLLVGEDGLARAIRFDRADTLFVSTGPKEMGERR